MTKAIKRISEEVYNILMENEDEHCEEVYAAVAETIIENYQKGKRLKFYVDEVKRNLDIS